MIRIFVVSEPQKQQLTEKHLDQLVGHIHSESELYELADVLDVRPLGSSVSPHQLNNLAYFMLGQWYAKQPYPRGTYNRLTTLLQNAGKGQLLSALQFSVKGSLSDKTAAISLSGKKILP